ncbi:MAG: hypothetical protein M3464_22350 [Chloroflexota bacterium]|nr:hypothetical protein [Chloroflexota bacterium]
MLPICLAPFGSVDFAAVELLCLLDIAMGAYYLAVWTKEEEYPSNVRTPDPEFKNTRRPRDRSGEWAAMVLAIFEPFEAHQDKPEKCGVRRLQ